MKRSADQAFTPAVPASGVFKPSANAVLDPKAYFAQFQQAALAGQYLAPPGTVAITPPAAAAASTAPAPGEKSEVHLQVEAASAVKCAGIIRDRGSNFTTVVAIEALATLATKSSYKLREELLGQAHVKKLCDRVRGFLVEPPPGLTLDLASKAGWSLTRFPEEVLGDKAATLAPLAKMLGAANPGTGWHVNTASKVLGVLAKAEVSQGNSCIMQHTALVSLVIKELVRDRGLKIKHLSQEELVNMLGSLAKARIHVPRKGETKKDSCLGTVRMEANDELYFDYATKRIIEEVNTMDGRLVAEVAHIHAQAGIRNEALFKAICPRIMAKQKELDVKTMGRCIKAYARFMIPLREESQGFRTMAVVAKGDFIRPSDKPKKIGGPKKYDQPVPLYEKTQVHGRG